MKLALCVSGGLGHLILLHVAAQGREITAVFTDAKSESIRQWVEERGIPLFVGNPRQGRTQKFRERLAVDVLLSVNYLFLIERDMISWPGKISINVHGSLLPKYRGRTPHVWAIINNESETGITAHVIDESCDTGPVIEQIRVPIGVDDTGGDLLNKFHVLYPLLIDRVFDAVEHDQINLQLQDEIKATYFGKRTPEDGQINWSWHKERIRNWVRAQADPYPGAFSWIGNKKFIIDELIYDDYGFHQNTPNGTILTLNPMRVKTPNGVVRITKARNIPQNMIVNQQLSSYEDSRL